MSMDLPTLDAPLILRGRILASCLRGGVRFKTNKVRFVSRSSYSMRFSVRCQYRLLNRSIDIAGSVYYLHDKIKQFTFTKPALPKSLPPGWTTLNDTQGRTLYVDPTTHAATYINPLYGIAPAGYDLRQTDTGRLFYVNRKDGSMTWHKPMAIDALPAGWEAGKTADGRMFV